MAARSPRADRTLAQDCHRVVGEWNRESPVFSIKTQDRQRCFGCAAHRDAKSGAMASRPAVAMWSSAAKALKVAGLLVAALASSWMALQLLDYWEITGAAT